MPDIQKIKIEDWKTVEYRACLERQRQMRQSRLADEIDDTLVLLEHPPVITLGRRGVVEGALLDTGSVPVVQTERGGEVTYHGPGQLVGYIFYKFKAEDKIPAFVNWIEQLTIGLLGEYSLEATRRKDHRGVWVDSGQLGLLKICSIGIALHHGVTMHGFALNIAPDMHDFARIRPCGLDSSVMASMNMLLPQAPQLEEVKMRLMNKGTR